MGRLVECIHSTVGAIELYILWLVVMECIHSAPYFIECTHSISLFVECVHSTTSSTSILIFSVQNIATSGQRCRDFVKKFW